MPDEADIKPRSSNLVLRIWRGEERLWKVYWLVAILGGWALATLVGAKIPLFEALSAMIDQVEKIDLRIALTNIRDQVREGTAFAAALESHPRMFSNLYVNMVRAGESSRRILLTKMLWRVPKSVLLLKIKLCL